MYSSSFTLIILQFALLQSKGLVAVLAEKDKRIRLVNMEEVQVSPQLTDTLQHRVKHHYIARTVPNQGIRVCLVTTLKYAAVLY